MKQIGYITITAILIVYSAALNGWALTKLWAWFITPTFGLETLSIPAAIGLSYVVSFMTAQIKMQDKEKSYRDRLVDGVSVATAKPLCFLAFGYVVNLFM
tara:strand:+ start:660 stop:959 length:300 start_codon:yes stop_codon:yes gene_type:complete